MVCLFTESFMIRLQIEGSEADVEQEFPNESVNSYSLRILSTCFIASLFVYKDYNYMSTVYLYLYV